MEVRLLPGVVKDDASVAVRQYQDTDKVRFVRGQPQTIGGREAASEDILIGICRGIHTWADNNDTAYAGMGTSKRLYAMSVDGDVTDITPAISRYAVANPFTTSSASTLVTVATVNHGLVEGQKVLFSNASAVGGLTLNGEFTVNESPATNSYTITASSAATSSASGGGSSVEVTVFLAPGLDISLGGFGFGTGGYGSGGYGSPSTSVSLVARTWSTDNWGQNGIFNPRGGGIYEWAPITNSSELVANGDFGLGSTAWTFGSAWSVSAGAANATAASTVISQSGIAMTQNAWHLVKYRVSAYTSGSVIARVNGVDIGTAVSSTAVSWTSHFNTSASAVTIALRGSAATLSIDDVSVVTLNYAAIIPNAPTQVTSAFVTAERILVACGNNLTGTFYPLDVSWSDQENNQVWTDLPSNFAGTYSLSTGSRIVKAIKVRMQNLIFTDTGVVSMRYTPDPDVVYAFTEIGTGCGLIGPNAVAEVNGGAVWMSSSKRFYTWSGGVPSPIECPVERYVFDNIAFGQADLIYCEHLSQYNEVWWFYPDGTSLECSRYVVYNYADNTWAVGTFDMTAYQDAGVFQFPIAVDANGQIWYMEKGNSVDGGNLAWSFTTGVINPTGQIQINGMTVDTDDLQGGYSISATQTIKNQSGIQTRTFGPYNVTASTGSVPMRVNGGEVDLTFSGNTAPMFFRLGQIDADIRQIKRRR
jgi:hypothetical protein